MYDRIHRILAYRHRATNMMIPPNKSFMCCLLSFAFLLTKYVVDFHNRDLAISAYDHLAIHVVRVSDSYMNIYVYTLTYTHHSRSFL